MTKITVVAALLAVASFAASAGTTPVPSLPGSSGTLAPSTGVKATFAPSVGNAPPSVYSKLLTAPGAVINSDEGYVTVPVTLSNGDIVNVTMAPSGRVVQVTR